VTVMPALRSDESSELSSILSKAFQVLRAFASTDRVMTLSQIARASGLPKSTVHRLIGRLVELGALEPHRSGYRIGMALFQIGVNTPANALRDRALPYLAALHRWSGLTVHFGVLRGLDVVYLEKLAPPDSPCKISVVGGRLPANCSALGKAMLAWEDVEYLRDSLPAQLPRMTSRSITSVPALISQLREIRASGLAREVDEIQPGLACIAAPIVVHDFAVAGVSVAYAASRPQDGTLGVALRDTAARIAVDCRARLASGRSYMFPRDI
jgi:DNA-binding IclR family transcriptional regulator